MSVNKPKKKCNKRPQQITDHNMPRSSKQAESIKNLTQIIRFKIKEASLESLFESDSGPSSEDSDLEELNNLQISPTISSDLIPPDSNKNSGYHLTFTLRQMGMFGNGASVGVLACFFRISEGSVILYCSRVVEAILSLESMLFGLMLRAKTQWLPK
ncbi:hypothetical protein VP01_5237g1 [Puccinia sorghi]|uniref:Uncharacterized protein n=1 Tax=Puccinia sorghi TaxID=27349 RepID=A0A0L6UKJ3_9BASI|nr:hypothetical protein VP01_5237g1 [Puccinia sorghi]